MEKEILKTNNLIAEFMGLPKVDGYEHTYKINDGKPNWYSTEPKYHESWDWLMPVVEKIESCKFKDDLYPEEDGEICIENYPFLRTFHSNMVRINRFSLHKEETKIKSTWSAVVEFIKWYNKQN